jgi:hypothetical protein
MKNRRSANPRNEVKEVNWNRIITTASIVAGTVGSAFILAKSVTGKSRRRSSFAKISNAVKIGSAALGIMAGGVKLFNDNLPDTSRQLQRKARKSYRRLRRKLTVI